MVKRPASTTPLNLQFEVTKTLYKLVSEALTPSYQISRHLVPNISENPAYGHPEHGITGSSKTTRATAKERHPGMSDSIRAYNGRMDHLRQTLDSSLELVTTLLCRFESTDVKPIIIDVCPTISEITPKPDGIGLLKSMGVLTGLALALAMEQKGRWSYFMSALLAGGEKCHKLYETADRLLELAKRHPEDKLLSEVAARLNVHSSQTLADALLDFIKMTLSKKATKSRAYLKEFISPLMWPLYPVQGYLKELSDNDSGGKKRASRPHPGFEVIADRLFGKETAKAIFFGERSSKSLNDAGRHFAASLSRIAGVERSSKPTK